MKGKRVDPIHVPIHRKDHAYALCIDSFLPDAWLTAIETRIPASQWILIADENVARQYPVVTQAAARENWRALTLPAGEENKTVRDYAALLDTLLANGIDRKTVLVAMGGGVVGDLVGFAAATVLRGVRFVQVPTTLLAQVDSSVGGKTGVNAAAGKNLVGAFHQPDLVLIDAAFLRTLPEREYLTGMAEVAKYGLLGDRDFFDRLIADADKLVGEAPERALLESVIAHCCRMKRDVVSADETEKGRRGLLNLGHTFAHVLESLAGFDGTVTHGEAVAVGCAMAARFSLRHGMLNEPDHAAIVDGLRRLRLPVELTGEAGLGRGKTDASYWREKLRPDAMRRLFLKDKKASSGTLTLVLLHGIGDARLHGNVLADRAVEIMLEFAEQ